MELLKTVVLGIVEGLTEWLPISSTGHMILVDEFIKLDVSKSFMDMFLVVIQLGAILAVVVLNFEKLNPFSSWKSSWEKRATWQLWYKVILACVPAAVFSEPCRQLFCAVGSAVSEPFWLLSSSSSVRL